MSKCISCAYKELTMTLLMGYDGAIPVYDLKKLLEANELRRKLEKAEHDRDRYKARLDKITNEFHECAEDCLMKKMEDDLK